MPEKERREQAAVCLAATLPPVLPGCIADAGKKERSDLARRFPGSRLALQAPIM
jgi:hypothetical protein